MELLSYNAVGALGVPVKVGDARVAFKFNDASTYVTADFKFKEASTCEKFGLAVKA